MTTLFLDIDGVLNHSGTANRWLAAGGHFKNNRHFELWRLFEPRCVEAVNILLELTNPTIVLSSSWRTEHTLDAMNALLASVGFAGHLVDQTPVLGHRGEEIEAYGLAHGLGHKDIVILEDECDVTPYRGRQVHTSYYGGNGGFTSRHIRPALRLCGYTSPELTNKVLHAMVEDRVARRVFP